AFPDSCRIFSVQSGRTVVAAGMALAFRDILEVPWAASRWDYRPLCPNNLLYWELIQSAIKEGFRQFDFGRSTPGEGTYFEAAGCRACGNTGYKGRIGIYEVFDVSEEIRSLVAAHAPMDELARAARRGGMTLLSEDAARKASRGQTTLEEALRVTVRDTALFESAAADASR
ncbi:MAG: GNAT family N-acetyltransferase, partial [Candidatus Eisenbacteria bacterium]